MRRIKEPELMDDAEQARAYAEADFAEVNAVFADRLCALVPPGTPRVALDLGTGPAEIPIRVMRQRPGWRVVAVDISHAMLSLARGFIHEAGFAEAIHLVIQDAKAMPFAAASFDVVFSNSILHHITATARLWAEVKRVAKPGAHVLIRDLARPATPRDAAGIVGRYAAHESALLREEFYRSLLSAYTPEEVRDQLAQAGLAHLEVAMVSDRHLDVFGRI